MSKDPHVEIKVKLGRNLFASNLIQEALLSLESTISDAIDYTLKVSLNLNEDIKSLSSDPNYLSIISQLDDPSSISDSELLLINSELQRYSDSGEKLKARNDQNNLYFNSILKCFEKSVDSATKIYDCNDSSELKNVIFTFMKFLTSTLFPFVAGIEAIHQILNSRSNKFRNTASYFEEMDEYYISCFKHAVSSKYLEDIVRSSFSDQYTNKPDIDECIKYVEKKQIDMAKTFFSEIDDELRRHFPDQF